jgi:serine/threonine protein kinase
MSKDTKIIDSNYYVNWLETSITEEYIKSYEYSDFEKIKPLGSGAFGKVTLVNRKNTSRYFALKTFNNDKLTLEEIVKEVYIILFKKLKL